MQVQITDKFFDLMKQVGVIESKVLITKGAKDGKPILQVGTRNAAKSFFLSLECPQTEFTFEGEDIAFMDFKEFASIVSAMEGPMLDQDKADPTFIEIVKNSTKIKYKLGDSKVFPPYFNVPDFEVQDSVLLTPDDMKHLLNTFALTNTSILTATVNDTKLELEFTGDQSLHKANDFLNLTQKSTNGNYSVSLPRELLQLIPRDAYTLMLNKDQNHVQFKLVDADYDLRIACQSMI